MIKTNLAVCRAESVRDTQRQGCQKLQWGWGVNSVDKIAQDGGRNQITAYR